MTYLIIALVIGLIAGGVFYFKPVLRLIAEKNAIPKIETVLFTEGKQKKSSVMDAIHQLTSGRLSDELAMDYFYKIKGLQVLNINKPMNFWVKIYLTTPTKVKLNYFEQVKFYETFLNYPKIESSKREDLELSDSDSRLRKFKASMKNQLAQKLITQKLA